MLLVTVLYTTACAPTIDYESIGGDDRTIHAVDFNDARYVWLVYDIDTRIVYIKQRTYEGYYCYTVYLSEHGKPYRYIDGKLEEVS